MPVAALVPLSRAQVARISSAAQLLPKNVLSLYPRPAGSALLRPSGKSAAAEQQHGSGVIAGASYHNDTSPPLRDMKPVIVAPGPEREANENPKRPLNHQDSPDEVVQSGHFAVPSAMPGPILNFDGIPFPGVVCGCAPPDTDGEVGLTQYVQIVNEGYQVFNKSTGASVLGPVGISTIWTGFTGERSIAFLRTFGGRDGRLFGRRIAPLEIIAICALLKGVKTMIRRSETASTERTQIRCLFTSSLQGVIENYTGNYTGISRAVKKPSRLSAL